MPADIGRKLLLLLPDHAWIVGRGFWGWISGWSAVFGRAGWKSVLDNSPEVLEVNLNSNGIKNQLKKWENFENFTE